MVIVPASIGYSQTSGSQSIQTPVDTTPIRIENGYYYQGRKELSKTNIYTLLQTNDLAYQKLKSAQSEQTVATILGYAGGFLIGWPIGTALSGKDANWTVAVLGGVLVGIAIPFARSANKQVRRGIDIYNNAHQKPKTTSFFREMRLGTTGNSIGLILKMN